MRGRLSKNIRHVKDTSGLLAGIKVGRHINNGPLLSTAKGIKVVYAMYEKARGDNPHIVVKVGGLLPMKGVELLVVSAAVKSINL
jgi:hypothetical protein